MNRLKSPFVTGWALLASVFLPASFSAFADDGFPANAPAKVRLGQMLFFDKILSGNRNISCASCHHPLSATGDGLSLGIGEGGRGLGPARSLAGVDAARFDVRKRIPRNAPALFNLGHREFQTLFHDGRVQADSSQPSGFRTPAGEQAPRGLDSALAAQALFPITSNDEMAGAPGSNPVADAAAAQRFAGPGGVWELLVGRLREIPEYVELFRQAYPGQVTSAGRITIVEVANAIAAFESSAWRADDSAYDRFMNGDTDCISRDARAGMDLFIGKAGCASCHTGRFQTDHRFHSIAMPQIGPGKGDGRSGNHDFGRERVTGSSRDRFKFRTPSLRNVALTAPYGHCGAYPDLESVIRHHLDPSRAIASYDASRVRMPNTGTISRGDHAVMGDRGQVSELAAASEISRISLTEPEIQQIIAFLHCLTDPSSLNLLDDVPARVPSGLPVFD